jgi:hypothetical protein
MDREWMYIGNRVSQRFIEGLETFLETAVEYKKPKNMSDVHYICCPCADCYNDKKTRDMVEIHEHLLVRGFMSGYTCWTEHDEYKEVLCHTRFLCQNRVLIVCMTKNQMLHTYGQKCSQITKCHSIEYNYYINNVFKN